MMKSFFFLIFVITIGLIADSGYRLQDFNKSNQSLSVQNISNSIRSYFYRGKDKNKTILKKRKRIKPDTSQFKKIWNKTIAQIKYSNTHLGIDFDNYKIDTPMLDLKNNLSFDKKRETILKNKLESSRYHNKYTPLIAWLDKRERVHFADPDRDLDSDELMQYVSEIIDPSKPFSKNTIDTVVQLNEFCYYFDKNKERFYRNGYTKNIKNCQVIQKILDKDGIQIEKNNKMVISEEQIWSLIKKKLPPKIASTKGLNVFVDNRAKFEGWLKVELCDILSYHYSIVPEQDTVDIVVDDKFALELKTVNTNYTYKGIENKTKPITDNINSVIGDIKKLQLKEYPNKAVVFVVFPLSLPNKNWNKQVNKITIYLNELYYKEITFENGQHGVLYFGLI